MYIFVIYVIVNEMQIKDYLVCMFIFSTQCIVPCFEVLSCIIIELKMVNESRKKY